MWWRPTPRGERVFENVVVGATDAEGAARAVRSAIEVTRASGGTLHLVMATRRRRRTSVSEERRAGGAGLDPTESLLNELRRMAAAESVRVETHPLFTDPVEGMTKVAAAESADLIVVAARTPHGGHLSSVSRAVMDAVDCAVMVV